MSQIGYNIHAQFVKDIGRLRGHVSKAKPSALVVMDGLGLADELHGLLPDCIVIHRNYGITKGDDDVHKRVSPQQWLDLRAKECEGGVWLYTTNEPAFDQQCIDWHVQLMELAAKQAIRLIVGNWSVGNPGPDDWGRAKRMLELLDQHRDLFILGLHEYACGVITSGLEGGWPDNAGVQPGTAVGRNYIPLDNWPEDASTLTKWHCGRFNFLLTYCKNNGLKPPRIILTEHGMDDVSDIKAWAEKLEKTDPYTGIRGWKTLRKQWESWYSAKGWSAERAYFEQLAWADRAIYRNTPVEGQCIFSWGHSSDDWEQFDVAEASEFQALLEAYVQKAVDVVPISILVRRPENYTEKVTVKALGNVFVRYGPDDGAYARISNSALSEIRAGDYVRFWKAPDLPAPSWVPCQIATGNHALEEGWVQAGFPYVKVSTREIPVVKPEPVLQSHTITVKFLAPAPHDRVLVDWLHKQLEGAGELFRNLDQISEFKFEVEETT